MIGQKAALGMILTGRRVPAAEGKELGFVNEVVPAGEALVGGQALGGADPRMLADGDPRLEAGRSTRASTSRPWRRRWHRPIRRRKPICESQDYIEGPRAFAERRKPNWQNR